MPGSHHPSITPKSMDSAMCPIPRYTHYLTSAGLNDIFIQKLDTSGNLLWAKSMGGALDDFGLSLDVDGSGNIYITGKFKDTADLDPGSGVFNLISAGDDDIFIQKLDIRYMVKSK